MRISEGSEPERLDLFTADAVAQLIEGTKMGREPVAYSLTWDGDVGANVISGVSLWASPKLTPSKHLIANDSRIAE